jgi:ribosomal protein L11 methyltransferase
MSAWLQINIESSPAQIEALSDFIITLSGRGVQINDHSPQLWELVGFLDEAERLPQALEDYLKELPEPYTLRSGILPEQNWHENWRRNFTPFQLTGLMWIAPPWEEAPLKPGQFAIIIDPGQAFGTGQHQTTRLCLLYLQALADAGHLPSSMLDVGCGTGILSLAFLRLGGSLACALDLDPLALEAARHNAALNRQDNLRLSSARLEDIDQKFPLLCANLTAFELCRLASPLSHALQPSGCLLASGMLNRQKDMVEDAMRSQGLSLQTADSLGEWSGMVFRKEAPQ